MSKWVEAAERALAIIKQDTQIPYDYDRYHDEKDELPDEYIVYFPVSAPSALSADNKELSYIPRIQVSFFFRKKQSFLTVPDKIVKAFTDAGFCRAGEGRIPYQTNTGHYGWRCDFNFYETR